MAKVLITGSGGFVFSNFVRQATHLKQGHSFVSIDKVRKSHVMHNIYINKNHQFYPGDICDKHFLDVIFEAESPDVVIHGAEEKSESFSNVKTNTLGTQNIIDACVKNNVKKLIYTSTDDVYGSLVTENSSPWSEDSVLNASTSYAASKLCAEELIKTSSRENNLKYIILRSCDNYGPWQGTESFIPNIAKSIINGEKARIPGDGSCIRDWIHVWDFCTAILTVLNSNIENEIYNVSARQELPHLEVFQRVCNTLGYGHDLADFDKEKNIYRKSLKNNKLKSLGWMPQFKFNDGIKQTLQWYLNNRWFLKVF